LFHSFHLSQSVSGMCNSGFSLMEPSIGFPSRPRTLPHRDWSPRLPRLLADNDGRYVDRPINTQPVHRSWEQNPTVTLLGEAVDAYEQSILPRSHRMQEFLDHGAEELLSTELPDFATGDAGH
jgi:hypothetical protein